jgi:hypothetical protein
VVFLSNFKFRDKAGQATSGSRTDFKEEALLTFCSLQTVQVRISIFFFFDMRFLLLVFIKGMARVQKYGRYYNDLTKTSQTTP